MGAGTAGRPAPSGPAPPDGLINDSPAAEGAAPRGGCPGNRAQVSADLRGLAFVARHQAWSARTLGLGGALIKGASSSAGSRRLFRLDEDGVTGAALATQTRLDFPCPLAQRSRAPHGRSRKGKGSGAIPAAPRGPRTWRVAGTLVRGEARGPPTPLAEITLGSSRRPRGPGPRERMVRERRP